MNKTQPPQEANDAVDQAYESSLENALNKSKQTDTSIHELLDGAAAEQKSASKSSIIDDVIQLEQSIKRDLLDAAHHMNETGKELKDWLGFDLMLIKNELWKKFTEATDKTTLELLKFKYMAANAEYHTGEIIGLGTLVCDQCKATLHFHKPGHIPPCGKCHGTRFHRQHRDV
ncbi:zinc ribbon-containing protein [Methylotenera sp.]|uniref:zinc ribbon-containing protein n=1 Tax=Methylotenera sp. TaxID=2051956 RepID=UPI002716CC95|nr:zinc ribbon-containing protein [Methylotenera sp.]MDO9204956.1 zinc ribbon-containing protein [Methylotenera sp.]MDO9393693.1 zinc ribbon-containing protein [Methylotenera sp.]MDP1523505.1 zinc ribbon-containing protein [Methylotenera sp.]MDP2071143.1 zinc ribbon-containing protein [Methylotenera sp.]MDP2230069.1 zinc ribbon-containing protein [Methylotenera sp.]